MTEPKDAFAQADAHIAATKTREEWARLCMDRTVQLHRLAEIVQRWDREGRGRSDQNAELMTTLADDAIKDLTS